MKTSFSCFFRGLVTSLFWQYRTGAGCMGVDIFSLHLQTSSCARCGGTLRRTWGLLCVSLTTCAASIKHVEVPFKMDLQD